MGFFWPVEKNKKGGSKKKGKTTRKQNQSANWDCEKCGLYREVNSPKMKMSGVGRLGIFIAGQSPGRNEDRDGRQFIGMAGDQVRGVVEDNGFEFDVDFHVQNAFRCWPQISKDSWTTEVRCCHHLFQKDVQKANPWLIVALGKEAIQASLSNFGTVAVAQYQSLLIPLVHQNSWVYCSNHPAAILHGGRGKSKYEWIFRNDWKEIRKIYERKRDGDFPEAKEMINLWDMENIHTVIDFEEAKSLLKKLQTRDFFFDYENYPLRPYNNDSEVLCWSVAFRDLGERITVFCIPWKQGFWDGHQRRIIGGLWKKALENPNTRKAAHNITHELHWSWFMGIEPQGRLDCTQIRQHMLREPKDTTALDFQVFARWGSKYDEDIKPFKKDMRRCPDDMLFPYSCHDSRFGLMLYEEQEKEKYPNFDYAYSEIMEKGSLGLAMVEAEGVKVDVDLANEIGDEFERKKDEIEEWLLEHEWAEKWKKERDAELNLNSRQQVGELLFEVIGLSGGVRTRQQWSTTVANLAQHRNTEEWIRNWQDRDKYSRFKGTFVDGHIMSNLWDDGLIHCSYRLDYTETYRSSCRDPNLQNIVKRDERGKVLRKAFVVRFPGWEMIEIDYDQHEVVTQCHYTQDSVMIDMILAGHDFHIDYAAKLLQKASKGITEHERSMAGKNGFVFPIFYGAYPFSIQKGLVKNGFNVTLDHVENIWNEFRDEFWQTIDWQEGQLSFYNTNGFVETFLGFRRRSPLSSNEIINFPIQSTAFHYLLRSFIIADWRMREEGLRARGIKQVHDSAEFHYPKEEREKVFEIIHETFLNLPWKWTKNPPVGITAKTGPDWYNLEKVSLN